MPAGTQYKLQHRSVGSQGLYVSAISLGCMGLSWGYGEACDVAKAVMVLQSAVEMGITHFDTAELYGPFTNEALISRALRGNRERVTIATKVGYKIEQGKSTGLDGTPAHIRQAVEKSLLRLSLDYIDLLYQHRVDPQVAIEETVGEMAKLVSEGKVRYIGLCEASSSTIARAHATHPLTAVQSEYSLWERKLETTVIPTLEELGIGLVAFCPLGRGIFGGQINQHTKFRVHDLRTTDPRFQPDTIAKNVLLVQSVEAVAARHHCSSAQVALAWLLHQTPTVVPIPGTSSACHLAQNIAAIHIRLTESELKILDTLAMQKAGDRPFRNVQ